MKISCVILASGNSTRFQTNKLLCPIHDRPMILILFDKIRKINFDKICVVTQYQEIKTYARQYGFDVVVNSLPILGISHSLQLGIEHCYQSDAIMFIVSDQPMIKIETLEKMLKNYCGQIMSCEYQGILFNPMIFPKKYFSELLLLKGDRGGKSIALKHSVSTVEIQQEECFDIDYEEDLKKLDSRII